MLIDLVGSRNVKRGESMTCDRREAVDLIQNGYAEPIHEEQEAAVAPEAREAAVKPAVKRKAAK